MAIAFPGARQKLQRAILFAGDQLNLVEKASGALSGWQMMCGLVVIKGSLPDEEILLLLNHLNIH